MLWDTIKDDHFVLIYVFGSALVAENRLRYKVWAGVDSNPRRRGASRFLVRSDPVGGYLALSGLEVQLAGAYELVELPFECIFYTRVPGRC
jgi:hypothetical protein